MGFYAYKVGALAASAEAAHPRKVTDTCLRNIAMRPDLVLVYLRHIRLDKFEIPEPPAGWKKTPSEENAFWLGYYKIKKQA